MPNPFSNLWQYFGKPKTQESYWPQNPIQPTELPVQKPEWMKFLEPMETPALDRYNQFLQTIPKPDDYKPSKLRRVVGAIGGFAKGWEDPEKGFDLAQRIVRRPYDRALEDWGNQGAGLKESAALEQQNLKGENAQLKTIADYYSKQANTNLGRDRLNAQIPGMEAQAERAIAQADALNRGKTIQIPLDDGRVYLYNDVTQEMMTVNGEKISDPMKLQEMKVKIANIHANASRYSADKGYEGRVYAADKGYETQELRNEGAANVAGIRGQGTEREPTIGTVKFNRQDDLLDVLMENPEYMEFVEEVNPGELAIKPPKQPGRFFGSGTDMTKYQEFINKLRAKDQRKVVRPPASKTTKRGFTVQMEP